MNNKKISFTAFFIIGGLWATTLQAQCNSWETYPKGVELAKEKHQVYRDLFNSKQYKEAFPIWQELFQYVQVPLEVPTRHYKDGIKFYKEQAKIEQDSTRKMVLLDTIILLYNQLADCLGEKSLDRAWQGYDVYALSSNAINYEQAMSYFEKAVQLGKEQTPEMVLLPMAQLAIYLFQLKQPKYTPPYLTNLYHQLQKISNYHLDKDQAKNKEQETKWDAVHKLFYSIKDSLPQIWGCDYYEKECRKSYELDSNNIEQNKIALALLIKYCDETATLYQQIYNHQTYLLLNTCNGVLINELTILKQANCRETQAKLFLRKGDTTQYEFYQKKAWDLYQKALEQNPRDSSFTDNELGELYYKFAYQAFEEGSFEKARKYCRLASQYKPSWGEPYLLVGTMYASSSKRCGKEDDKGWHGKVVLWAAMDEWEKAQKIDVAAKEQAMTSIRRYLAYLPTVSEAFAHSLNEGDSYKINCWIQQETTVRVAKE